MLSLLKVPYNFLSCIFLAAHKVQATEKKLDRFIIDYGKDNVRLHKRIDEILLVMASKK